MLRLLAPVLLLLLSGLAGCFSNPTAASNDLVSDATYTQLVVELDYVDGYKARDEAVNLLLQRIQERLSKPDGATKELTVIQSSRGSYTVDDLREMESQHRDHQPDQKTKTMVLYVLYLNGNYNGDDNVLGVQYGRASIAIFKRSVDAARSVAGTLFNSAEVEKAVLVHEFGHASGLVNNGLEMVTPHEDSGHPHHSTNEDSVMYWAIENALGLNDVTGSIPNDFDANDKADIRAGGGK